MWGKIIKCGGINMSRRNIAAVFTGLITLLVSIFIFFMVTRTRNLVLWEGFFFIILAEVIFFSGVIFTDISSHKINHVMFRSGMYTALAIYFIAAVATSLVTMILFPVGVVALAVIEVILVAITLVIGLAIFISAKSVYEKDSVSASAMDLMRTMKNEMKAIIDMSEESAVTEKLNKIYEMICYGDFSSATPKDEEIHMKINDLRNRFNKGEDTQILLKEIEQLLSERKSEMAHMKVGKF